MAVAFHRVRRSATCENSKNWSITRTRQITPNRGVRRRNHRNLPGSYGRRREERGLKSGAWRHQGTLGTTASPQPIGAWRLDALIFADKPLGAGRKSRTLFAARSRRAYAVMSLLALPRGLDHCVPQTFGAI